MAFCCVDHAVFIWNNLPSKDIKLCPLEILSNTLFPDHNHLQRAHVFGCPVYVLDPCIQDNQKIPKWSMRSRRGVYLGVSKEHSSTVHLVLNPSTDPLPPPLVPEGVSTNSTPTQPRMSRVRNVHFPPAELPITSTPEGVPQEIISSPEGAPTESAPVSSPEGAPQTPILPQRSSTQDALPSANSPASPAPALRRSTRTRWIPDRLTMFGKLG